MGQIYKKRTRKLYKNKLYHAVVKYLKKSNHVNNTKNYIEYQTALAHQAAIDVIDNSTSEINDNYMALNSVELNTLTYKQAMNSEDHELFEEEMEKEIANFMEKDSSVL